MNSIVNISLKELVREGRLSYFSCLISLVVLPIHVDFLPPIMILWILCWILENHSGFKNMWHFGNPGVILFSGFVLYIIWYIAGLIYTSDVHNGTLLIFRRLSFIAFPFVLISPGEYIIKNVKQLLKVFCLSTLAFIIFAFAFSLYRSTSLTGGQILFNPHPPEYDYANYFFGTDFAFSQHPTYLALYVMLSIFIAFESFFDNKLKTYSRILWLISVVILLSSLFFLSSRAGILSGIILVPIYLILQLKKIKKVWASLLIILVVLPILIFSLVNNERIKVYLPETSNSSIIEKFMLDNRVPIWKSSIKVIRNNPIIGVGAGDASKEIRKEYVEEGYSEMYYNNLNAHNQYLEVLVGSGLIGFILFISILGYILYLVISGRSLIYGIFITFILIFFLFESILNRIAGVTFFALFSFLLIQTRGVSETKES